MKKLILMLMLFVLMSMFAQKFGHLSSQQVMNDIPEFMKARGETEATAKQYGNDLKVMQDELQRKAEEYEKTKSTMNAAKRKEIEDELMKLNEKIRAAYNDNSQTLQKAQQEKMQPITAKLVNAIQAVGKAGNYVYIMDITSGIPYISQTLSEDITAKVKTELAKTR